MIHSQFAGVGRRKSAVARVYLRPGSGAAVVNGEPIDKYFQNELLRTMIRQPLVATETSDKFDVQINVSGGGHTGQAGAVRLGVARALLSYDPEVRKKLRASGLLTSDSRVKERKKYGQKGARKRFQFSKR